MSDADPQAVTNAVERILEGGELREQIDTSLLDSLPIRTALVVVAASLLGWVVFRIVRRIRLRVELTEDPFALPDRHFSHRLERLQEDVRRRGDRGEVSPEEEGRWKKILRESAHAVPRYEKLVALFQTDVEARDIQFVGDLKTIFDEMVEAWKGFRASLEGLEGAMGDREHLVNIRRRANDRLQDFLDAARAFENRYDEVTHQRPAATRRRV